MSGPIRQRILTALRCTEEIVGELIPVIMPNMNLFELEEIITNVKNSIRELDNHVHDVRTAREAWGNLTQRLTQAERPGEDQTNVAFNDDNGVGDKVHRANTRLRELRALETVIQRRINQINAV